MNVLERLLADHRRFQELADELDRQVLGSGNRSRGGWGQAESDTTQKALETLLPDMLRHERIERTLLFPALLKLAPVEASLLESIEREHSEFDALLSRFLGEQPKAEDRPTTWMLLNLMRLTSMLQRHMLFEEQELFTLAERHIPKAELERLGAAAEKLLAEGAGSPARPPLRGP